MSEKQDAAATDPKARGLMAGFPPAPEATIRFDDDTSSRFPNVRWAFSHQRELKATTNIWRGRGAPCALPYALRDDLDAIPFTTMDGEATTWGGAVDTMFTDGLLVMHRGSVVYERYLGALEPQIPHLAMSITKSFTGLLASMLAHEGVIDPEAPAVRYVPELAGGAYGDATVRNIMDMTVGVQYSENYVDPNAEVRAYSVAANFRAEPKDYSGPRTIFDFVRALKKSGEHGQAFAYKTCNTEVLAWIIQRAANTAMPQLLSEKIWQRLGVEEDAYIAVDRIGMAMAGAALNLTLRDMARFGEMMRLNGAFNGQQIVPPAVVADISGGGKPEHFAKAGYVTLPGWSYRSQWWVSHNALGAYTARGIHGQVCWIAPKAELVIARFASHPTAANGNSILDRVSLPAYAALAEHLMRG